MVVEILAGRFVIRSLGDEDECDRFVRLVNRLHEERSHDEGWRRAGKLGLEQVVQSPDVSRVRSRRLPGLERATQPRQEDRRNRACLEPQIDSLVSAEEKGMLYATLNLETQQDTP